MMNANEITTELMERCFTSDEQVLLKIFSAEILKDKPNLSKIWEYDKSLGGLGGYAMPSNPVTNPFNTWGKDRNLFRSVQYAKSGFIYYPHIPRNMIIDAGRSLEYTCKYILGYYSVMPRLKNNEMLGKTLDRLYKKEIIDQNMYVLCGLLNSLHNLAKHTFSDDQSRTFSALDGVVAYFALRKIHNQLLDDINHSSRRHVYNIYNNQIKG